MIEWMRRVWSQGCKPILQNSLQQSLDHLNQRLSDWAQLGFYQQANATLPLPTNNDHRIVFFGDSITEFWDLTTYFPGKPYINRGISGQTTPQLLIRFRPDVIALQPKVVVILAGTNDIAGNTGPMSLAMIQDNYASIAELAQAHQIQVIFASVLPIHDYGLVPRSGERPPAQIGALNAWLQRYCVDHHLTYLDYHSFMVDQWGMLKAELSEDGLHLNSKGYAIMTTLADAVIQRVL